MHDPASYIRQRTDLPESELEWMAASGRTRRLARGDAFLGIGVERHELGFIQDGILQCYAVSQDGERIVLDIIFAGQFIAALDSALQGQPAEVCFEALTPVVMKVWPFEIRDVAMARSIEWLRLQSAIIAEAYIRKQKQYLALRTLSAQERHARLESDFPPEWRQVPLHILASYLGITPQYLSALRKAALGS